MFDGSGTLAGRLVKGGDKYSCPVYVMDLAWGDYPVVAEMAFKPGVVKKLGFLFGNLIAVRVRRAEQFVKRHAHQGMAVVNVFHL
jgi:hypothetical protein